MSTTHRDGEAQHGFQPTIVQPVRFLFCDMLHGWNPKAVGYLAWSTINGGDDLSDPARYLNEAMADYFTGQVAGGMDYGWLPRRPDAAGNSRPSSPPAAKERWDDEDDREPQTYCVDPISPSALGEDCWEQNLNDVAVVGDSRRSIGRIATLVMDAMDGHNAPRVKLPHKAGRLLLDVTRRVDSRSAFRARRASGVQAPSGA